jgi:hypothetical protein
MMEFPRTVYRNVSGSLQSTFVQDKKAMDALAGGPWFDNPLAAGIDLHPSSTGPVNVSTPPGARPVEKKVAATAAVAGKVTPEQAKANLAAANAKAAAAKKV